jgi:predicted metal-binding membrane protein
MDQVAITVAVVIAFGLIFALGEWLFRRLAGSIDSRLHAGWRWMTLPITAVVGWAGFLALRPLVLDQPQTPLWFILSFVAVASLVVAATAMGLAVFGLGRWFVNLLRSSR